MTGAMVERQLDHRRIALANMVDAQFAGGRLTAAEPLLPLVHSVCRAGRWRAPCYRRRYFGRRDHRLIRLAQPGTRSRSKASSAPGRHSLLHEPPSTAYRRAFENMEEQRHIYGPAATQGVLQVEEVGLRGRDGRPILVGVSFRADPGKILGIIGPSGSGKTTLGKILVGALQPTVGTVRLDGAASTTGSRTSSANISAICRKSLRCSKASIKENIARFTIRRISMRPSVSMRRSLLRLKEAGVHDLILQLPQGYDTSLGLLGSGLSAGQAQRVALARALFGEPRLLVLDEPNAFLDEIGEAALIASLAAARARGATVIVIAHRRSVLAGADRLLVLDDGRPK